MTKTHHSKMSETFGWLLLGGVAVGLIYYFTRNATIGTTVYDSNGNAVPVNPATGLPAPGVYQDANGNPVVVRSALPSPVGLLSGLGQIAPNDAVLRFPLPQVAVPTFPPVPVPGAVAYGGRKCLSISVVNGANPDGSDALAIAVINSDGTYASRRLSSDGSLTPSEQALPFC